MKQEDKIGLVRKQGRNQKFFNTGEVSLETQEEKVPQGKKFKFFLLDTLKTAFGMKNLILKTTLSGPFLAKMVKEGIDLVEVKQIRTFMAAEVLFVIK